MIINWQGIYQQHHYWGRMATWNFIGSYVAPSVPDVGDTARARRFTDHADARRFTDHADARNFTDTAPRRMH